MITCLCANYRVRKKYHCRFKLHPSMSACPCEVLLCLALANIPFTLHTTPQCRFNYAHCTDEKTEPLRDYAICPDLHSEIMRARVRTSIWGDANNWVCKLLFSSFFNFTQDINMVCFVWGDENSFFLNIVRAWIFLSNAVFSNLEQWWDRITNMAVGYPVTQLPLWL